MTQEFKGYTIESSGLLEDSTHETIFIGAVCIGSFARFSSGRYWANSAVHQSYSTYPDRNSAIAYLIARWELLVGQGDVLADGALMTA